MKADLSLLEPNRWPFLVFPALLCALGDTTIWNMSSIQHCWHQFPVLFFFFFVNSYRCFVSVLKWISLSCTCQLNRAEVGSAGGLIRTEVCVERVPLCGCRKRLWNAPLSTKDCVGISLQLMYHNTQCNVICFLLCGCLSADPSCCTVLLSLSVFVCIDYGQQ